MTVKIKHRPRGFWSSEAIQALSPEEIARRYKIDLGRVKWRMKQRARAHSRRRKNA